MLQYGRALKAGTATRVRERAPRRFDEEVVLGPSRMVDCQACGDEVAEHDMVLSEVGSVCIRCHREGGIADALHTESTEMELGLSGVAVSLFIAALAAVFSTWMFFASAWVWSFFTWVAAQILCLWLGFYGSRQGYDAIRTLNGLDDDGIAAVDPAREVRIRLLAQLSFWGGAVAAGASLLSLTTTFLATVWLSVG